MNTRSRTGSLKGIGEKTEKLFQKMGIHTVGDLIRYYPRGFDIYEDPVPISEIEEGKTVTIADAALDCFRCREAVLCR